MAASMMNSESFTVNQLFHLQAALHNEASVGKLRVSLGGTWIQRWQVNLEWTMRDAKGRPFSLEAVVL